MRAISLSSTLTTLTSHARRGFTLIEIAIVLVVIGLIVSGGLLAVGPVIQGAKTTETKQKIATVESALLGYAIANGCLPCPATTNQTTGAALAGVRNNGAGTYNTACSAGACINNGVGILPWITLGLPEGETADAWGNRLTYAVDPALTAASSVQRTNGVFPTFTSTLAIETETGAAQAAYTSIAYVLISHGRDLTFGEAITTGQTNNNDRYAQTGTGVGQDENRETNLTFAVGSANTIGAAGYFDDIVTFKSLAPLIVSCGAGSCGNPN